MPLPRPALRKLKAQNRNVPRQIVFWSPKSQNRQFHAPLTPEKISHSKYRYNSGRVGSVSMSWSTTRPFNDIILRDPWVVSWGQDGVLKPEKKRSDWKELFNSEIVIFSHIPRIYSPVIKKPKNCPTRNFKFPALITICRQTNQKIALKYELQILRVVKHSLRSVIRSYITINVQGFIWQKIPSLDSFRVEKVSSFNLELSLCLELWRNTNTWNKNVSSSEPSERHVLREDQRCRIVFSANGFQIHVKVIKNIEVM